MYFKGEGHADIPTKDCLSWIFDEPLYDEDKPTYIDAANPTNFLSKRKARSVIRKLIAGLRRAGLKKGDCVCLHSFNDIYFSMLVLAIIGAGGVFAGTNPSYTPFEIAHHIKSSKTSFLITEPEMIDAVTAAAKECGVPMKNVFIFDVLGQAIPKEFKSWKWLMEHGEEDWVRFDDLETSKKTTACRLFSSGTTGLPKAADLSHYNLVAQHTLVNASGEKDFEIRRLFAIPEFHAAAVPSAHFSTLRSGAYVYIMRRFDTEGFFRNIEKYGITELLVVPPMAIALIMSPLNKKYSLKSVRFGMCGAAPLDKGPQARMQALLGEGAPLTQVWGMTEVSCIATMFPYPEHDTTGSVGRLLPNLEIKLVDDDGKNISAYDVQGEICIRGPTVINGYFNNPEANAASWDAEGFFHTGDIAYCSGKTKLWYIVDRKKELVKVRGFQVAPPELEGVLLSHPNIIDAAVIGVQYSVTESELPRAYVVRRPTPEGKALAENEVYEYTAERLAKYKKLDGGVRFIDAIPKNASGKILKRVLREEAKKEISAGKAKL